MAELQRAHTHPATHAPEGHSNVTRRGTRPFQDVLRALFIPKTGRRRASSQSQGQETHEEQAKSSDQLRRSFSDGAHACGPISSQAGSPQARQPASNASVSDGLASGVQEHGKQHTPTQPTHHAKAAAPAHRRSKSAGKAGSKAHWRVSFYVDHHTSRGPSSPSPPRVTKHHTNAPMTPKQVGARKPPTRSHSSLATIGSSLMVAARGLHASPHMQHKLAAASEHVLRRATTLPPRDMRAHARTRSSSSVRSHGSSRGSSRAHSQRAVSACASSVSERECGSAASNGPLPSSSPQQPQPCSHVTACDTQHASNRDVSNVDDCSRAELPCGGEKGTNGNGISIRHTRACSSPQAATSPFAVSVVQHALGASASSNNDMSQHCPSSPTSQQSSSRQWSALPRANSSSRLPALAYGPTLQTTARSADAHISVSEGTQALTCALLLQRSRTSYEGWGVPAQPHSSPTQHSAHTAFEADLQTLASTTHTTASPRSPYHPRATPMIFGIDGLPRTSVAAGKQLRSYPPPCSPRARSASMGKSQPPTRNDSQPLRDSLQGAPSAPASGSCLIEDATPELSSVGSERAPIISSLVSQPVGVCGPASDGCPLLQVLSKRLQHELHHTGGRGNSPWKGESAGRPGTPTTECNTACTPEDSAHKWGGCGGAVQGAALNAPTAVPSASSSGRDAGALPRVASAPVAVSAAAPAVMGASGQRPRSGRMRRYGRYSDSVEVAACLLQPYMPPGTPKEAARAVGALAAAAVDSTCSDSY